MDLNKLRNRLFGGSGSTSDNSPSVSGKNIISEEDIDNYVDLASKKYSVPKALIRAVIDMENPMYDASAKNPFSSATGLMQMIKGTSDEMGVTDPTDPYQNIMGGTKYLRQMLNKYGGDQKKAVAAYFKGPGVVDKHLASGNADVGSIQGTDNGTNTTVEYYLGKVNSGLQKYGGETFETGIGVASGSLPDIGSGNSGLESLKQKLKIQPFTDQQIQEQYQSRQAPQEEQIVGQQPLQGQMTDPLQGQDTGIGQAKIQQPQLPDKPWFGKALEPVAAVESGAARLAGGVAKIPSAIWETYNTIENNFNKLLNSALGTKFPTDTKVPEVMHDNKLTRYIEEHAKQYDVVGMKYKNKGDDLVSLIKKKDVGGVADYLYLSVLGQVPQLAGITVAQMAGIPASATLGAMGASSGAEKLDEYRDKVKAGETSSSQEMGVANAWVNGLAEAAFERMGSYSILEKLTKALKGTAVSEVGKTALKSVFKGLLGGFAEEAKEEIATSIVQDISDKISGINEKLTWKDIIKHAFEAGTIGGLSGGIPGAAGGYAQYQVQGGNTATEKAVVPEIKKEQFKGVEEIRSRVLQEQQPKDTGKPIGLQFVDQSGNEVDTKTESYKQLENEAGIGMPQITEQGENVRNKAYGVKAVKGDPGYFNSLLEKIGVKSNEELNTLLSSVESNPENFANATSILNDKEFSDFEDMIISGMKKTEVSEDMQGIGQEENQEEQTPEVKELWSGAKSDKVYGKRLAESTGLKFVGIEPGERTNGKVTTDPQFIFEDETGNRQTFSFKTKASELKKRFGIQEGIGKKNTEPEPVTMTDGGVQTPDVADDYTDEIEDVTPSVEVQQKAIDLVKNLGDENITIAGIEGGTKFKNSGKTQGSPVVILQDNANDGKKYPVEITEDIKSENIQEIINNKRGVKNEGIRKVGEGKNTEKTGKDVQPENVGNASEETQQKKEEVRQNEKVNTEPTEAQKKAGNYPKEHIRRDGFEISIENKAGTERSGKDKSGKEWKTKMNHDYGYIRGTKGADAYRERTSDQVDVFIKPGSKEGGTVYVINQVDPKTGKFDEHKVMMGFDSEESAKKAYLSNYEKGWKGFKNIVPMEQDQFKEWVYSTRTKYEAPVNNNFESNYTDGTIEKTEQKSSLNSTLISRLKDRIGTGEKIKNTREILDIADEVHGGTIAQGKYGIRDVYDALETAMNKYIEEKGLSEDPKEAIKQLNDAIKILPTQTVRTEDQVEKQQFSTPPSEAYLAVKASGLKEGMSGLEPSAGDGNIATMMRIANKGKGTIYVNEIDIRRQENLRELGFEPTNADAEYLHSTLPKEIQPDVVVMNPPFSATGGRLKKHDTGFGAEHVKQALLRLKDGGRLVAIVGNGMAFGKPKMASWWNGIREKYNVRANVGISGKEYKKYGTGFDNNIIIIDKTGKTESLKNVITGSDLTIDKAYDLLEPLMKEDVNGRIKRDDSSGNKKVGGEVSGGKTTEKEPGIGPDTSSTGGSGRGSTGKAGTGTNKPAVEGMDKSGNQLSGESGIENRRQTDNGGKTTGAVKDERKGDEEPNAESGNNDTGGSERKPSGEGRVEEEDGGVYVKYKVKKATYQGSVPHQANIVESATMASVDLPDVTYKLDIPKEVIEKGAPSDIQLEAATYAGQAHEQRLPDGRRKEFLLGDSTGTGKTITILTTIYDNWMKGRKKHVIITKSKGLIKDLRDDMKMMGVDIPVIDISEYRMTDEISVSEGILFSTYATASGNWVKGKERYNQIKKWFGQDSDGVFVFDEAHMMKNASAETPTNTGSMGVKFKEELKNARFLNASATAATNSKNLAYLTRMGLWGEGSSFKNFTEFLGTMSQGGLGAMELLSRDMKSNGNYISRTISYKGVDYETLNHTMNETETLSYNSMADFWSEILQKMDEAAKNAGLKGRAARNHAKQYYAAQQRFFLQLMVSFQVETMLKDADKKLNEGKSVVISLFNTNEQQTEKKVGDAQAQGIDIDDMDFTPRDMMIDMIKNNFPVYQYQEVQHEDGTKEFVMVKDNTGNPLKNAENEMIMNELVDKVATFKMPDNPLDRIVNYFGDSKVAEVTGRKKRIVMINGKKVYKARASKDVSAKDINRNELDQFMDGKKRIAVLSGAAATGFSFHASTKRKNQQRRVFYALQLSWSADQQMQAFGRVHRTMQASAPEIVLVQTDIASQKRLVNTIQSRLASLGAISKGERESLSGGIFSIEDITDDYGMAALRKVMTDMKLPELERMGLVTSKGQIKDVDVDGFLNRLMVLRVKEQNVIFDKFYNFYRDAVDAAKESGLYDTGVEKIKGDNVRMEGDPIVLSDDKQSGVKTEILNVAHDVETQKRTFKQAMDRLSGKKNLTFVKNKTSGDPYLAYIQEADIYLYGPRWSSKKIPYTQVQEEFWNKYERVESEKEFEKLWTEKYKSIPKISTQHTHIITGSIFNNYKKIFEASNEGSFSKLKVKRAVFEDGTSRIGVYVPQSSIEKIKQNFGIGTDLVTASPEKIVDLVKGGSIIEFDNRWKLKKSRVKGEERIELNIGNDYNTGYIEKMGLFNEIIASQKRYFVPTGDTMIETVKNIMDRTKPVRDLTVKSTESEMASAPIEFRKDQIKTPAFKKWFGDWENDPDIINVANTIDNTDNKQRAARRIFEKKFVDKFYNGEKVPVVGVRYGDAPESGKSYNTMENRYESGISTMQVNDLPGVNSFAVAAAKSRDLRYYTGMAVKEVGGDGEILITDVTPINKEEYNSFVNSPEGIISSYVLTFWRTDVMGSSGQSRTYPDLYKKWDDLYNKKEADLVGLLQSIKNKKYADNEDLKTKEKQTRTPEFKAWFGDWENDPNNSSKVVDENGIPLIVYHGTNSEKFEQFDLTKGGYNYDDSASKIGIFFTADKEDAKFYGKNVGSYYINLRKPKTITDDDVSEFTEQWLSDLEESNPEEYRFQMDTKQYQNSRGINKGLELAIVNAKKRGYDGAIVELQDTPKQVISFSPNQIKSATENTGKFDAEDGNIYASAPVYTSEQLSTPVTPSHREIEPKDLLKVKSEISVSKKLKHAMASQKVGNHISWKPSDGAKDSEFLSTAEKIYTDFKELAFPVLKLEDIHDESMEVSKKTVKKLDIAIERVRGAIGAAKQFIDDNLTPVFDSIGKKRGEVYAELVKYMIAKRTQWLYQNKQYVDSNLDEDTASNMVDFVETGVHPYSEQIQKLADQIWKYPKMLIDIKKEHGIIDEEFYSMLDEPYYVPFYRDLPNKKNNFPAGRSDVYTTTSKGIRKIKGSERGLAIIDPVQSMLKQTYETFSNAYRADVVNAIIDMAQESEEVGKYIQKVDPKWMKVGTIEYRGEIDSILRPKLEEFAKSMGFEIEYKAKLKSRVGGKWQKVLGKYSNGKLETLIGATESTFAHEMGHGFHEKVSWYDQLITDFKEEFDRVADTRYEGLGEKEEVPSSYIAYCRSRNEKAAEFISMYVTDRDNLRSIAPNAIIAFEANLMADDKLSKLIDLNPSNVKGLSSINKTNWVMDRSIPKDEDVISVLRNGKIVSYKAPLEVAYAIKNLHPSVFPVWARMLMLPGRMFRAGAVGLNLAFAVPNMFKDNQDAAFNSRVIPVVDFFAALKNYVMKDEVYKQWMRAGGEVFGEDVGVKATVKRAQDMQYGSKWGQYLDPYFWKEHGIMKGTTKAFVTALESPFDLIKTIISASEIPSRLAVYKASQREYPDWLKTYFGNGVNAEEAIVISRNATGNPQRFGKYGRSLNEFFPFINMALEGYDKMGRTIKEDPKRAALKAFIWGTIPMTALWIWNRDKEKYKLVPAQEKLDNWIIMRPDGDDYFKIPKGHIQKFIVNGPQMAFEKMDKLLIKTMDKVSLAWLESISPINAGSIHPVLRLVLEPMANYDFYWQQQIEKPVIEKLTGDAKGYRSNARTSELLKQIGKGLNISPVMMQHEVELLGAGTAQNILWIADIAMGKIDAEKFKVERAPITKRFYGKCEEWKSDIQNEIKNINQELTNIRKTSVKNLINYNKYTPDEAIKAKQENLKQIPKMLKRRAELMKALKAIGEIDSQLKE